MNGSIMNVVYCDRGLLWTCSVMNETGSKRDCNKRVCNDRVCIERGLLWTLSVMNVVCNECCR